MIKRKLYKSYIVGDREMPSFVRRLRAPVSINPEFTVNLYPPTKPNDKNDGIIVKKN